MTKTDVLKLIGAAQMMWPGWRSAPETVEEASLMADVWLVLLEDLPADLVQAALTSLAAEAREFVPPVGVLRHHAVVLRARANGQLPPGTDEAWTEVRQFIARHGRTKMPDRWTHECIDAAVAAIGWSDLTTSTNPEALRAHFTKFYDRSVDRYTTDLVMSPTMREAISAASLAELTRG